MSDQVISMNARLKKANESMIEELYHLRKIQRAVDDFFESMQKHGGIKMSELKNLAEAAQLAERFNHEH